MTVLFENNQVNDAKYGLRVYGFVQAVVRENILEDTQYGIYVYDKARISIEKNRILESGHIGVLLEDSVLADLGGGNVVLMRSQYRAQVRIY
jgi:parallel beta-helix repeat protein